ncbi:hypothetical protein [Nocardia farcinica]|uniref:hypothetical protein n=1 Tax=Nocardia farcinica TaxID=37329 RepID=UPI002458A574|nr:hypothetical protein [Nocardia farcinica]
MGALVAGLAPLRDTAAGLVAALVAGQLLGHLTLGAASGHLHHGDPQLSWRMLLAHLVAAVAAAIVIRGAEAAYRIGTAVLARVLPRRPSPPVLDDDAPLRTRYRERLVLRVFAARALRTRAPPRPVFTLTLSPPVRDRFRARVVVASAHRLIRHDLIGTVLIQGRPDRHSSDPGPVLIGTVLIQARPDRHRPDPAPPSSDTALTRHDSAPVA